MKSFYDTILVLAIKTLICGESNGNPLQYSCLEKSHGWRRLVGCSPWGHYESDTTEWLHFHVLEKEMATHSSVLAWRIPGMGKPGRLPSMGSHSVGHDWSDLAAAAALKHWYASSAKKVVGNLIEVALNM